MCYNDFTRTEDIISQILNKSNVVNISYCLIK